MTLDAISGRSIQTQDVSIFSSATQLKYYGGKVLKNPSFVSLFYGSFWKTRAGKSEAAYEDGFAKFLVQSAYTSIWAEYGVNKGKFLGSSVVTPTRTPRSVNDMQLQQIVAQQIFSGSAPRPDGKTVYTVFLPPGTILEAPGEASSLDGIGGYHSSFDYSNGKRVYYAAIVYSEGRNGVDFGAKPRDNISIVASHEWAEAVTDPDVNNGKLGWYNEELGEVADIPINQGLPLEQVYERMGKYAVQKLWSNQDGQNELVSEHPGKVKHLPHTGSMIAPVINDIG